jgi:hypothetical protein
LTDDDARARGFCRMLARLEAGQGVLQRVAIDAWIAAGGTSEGFARASRAAFERGWFVPDHVAMRYALTPAGRAAAAS